MMTDNSLIYILTVSKSLLIVLGTSPKPTPFWAMESAALWKTKARFPQGLDNKSALPTLPTAPITAAVFLHLLLLHWMQERRGRPTSFLASLSYRSAHHSCGSALHVRAVPRMVCRAVIKC
jgi:hypothetical protein